MQDGLQRFRPMASAAGLCSDKGALLFALIGIISELL